MNYTNEELCKQYQAGNEKALQQLCVQNVALVNTLAKQFFGTMGNHLSMEDLEQHVYIALIESAKKYDTEQDTCKFSSFFTTRAKWRLKQLIPTTGFAVRLPPNMYCKVYPVMTLDVILAPEYPKFADRVAEIAKQTNMTEKQVLDIFEIKNNVLFCPSLDVEVGEGEKTFLRDLVASPEIVSLEDEICNNTLSEELSKLMELLNDREKTVIKHRYENELSLEQIGQMIGVTRERVRQIENKALYKLRKRAYRLNLDAYLYA